MKKPQVKWQRLVLVEWANVKLLRKKNKNLGTTVQFPTVPRLNSWGKTKTEAKTTEKYKKELAYLP